MNEIGEDDDDDARSISSNNGLGTTPPSQVVVDPETTTTATIPLQQYHHVSVNARDHSYLPEISSTFAVMMDADHEWDGGTTTGNSGSTSLRTTPAGNTPFPLVCWYTHDLVVLPGVTVPLRLLDDPATQPEAHQRALQKLRQLLQSSRQCPGTVPAVYLGIWSSIDTPGHQGDDDSGDSNDDSSTTSTSHDNNNNGEDQMRHRQQQRQWRRQSWTRLGMGPNRLRRLSERVRQELSTTDWQAIAAVAGNSSSSSEGEADDDENDDNNDGNTQSSSGTPSHPMQDNSGGGDGRDREASTPSNKRKRWSSRPGPWHGNIGTLLSVVFTHQITDETSPRLGSSSAPLNHNMEADDNSLILTAKAIGRFRIVDSRATTLASDPYAHARRRVTSGHLVELWVEEWSEKPLGLLPMRSVPTPYVVPRRLDPTRQVRDLKTTMQAIPSLLGMMKVENQSALPTDPIRFSYWLATNLPSLTLGQKLKILEMPTATERLAYLQTSIEALKDAEAVIHCANCQFPLARARQVFSVAGAAGTTGAYVNPHGIIHETVTLRNLDLLEEDSDIWLLGGPETRDSWFPGYAWTICNCALCGNHLGWKFDKVFTPGSRTDVENGDHRPKRFFGLSAGQIQSRIPTRRPSPAQRQRPGR